MLEKLSHNEEALSEYYLERSAPGDLIDDANTNASVNEQTPDSPYADMSFVELAHELAKVELTNETQGENSNEEAVGHINDAIDYRVASYVNRMVREGKSKADVGDVLYDSVMGEKDRYMAKLNGGNLAETTDAQDQPTDAEEDNSEADNSAETANSLVKLDVGDIGESIVRDDNIQLYGVLGSQAEDVKAASQAATAVLQEAFQGTTGSFSTIDEAEAVMQEALRSVSEQGDMKTAAAFKIEVINGETYGIGGNFGESRVLVDISRGASGPLTEGNGAVEVNTIRLDGNREVDGKNLNGDRVMISSGRVIGSTHDAFKKAVSAQDSAIKFTELSEGSGDKSVLVLDIEEAPGTGTDRNPSPAAPSTPESNSVDADVSVAIRAEDEGTDSMGEDQGDTAENGNEPYSQQKRLGLWKRANLLIGEARTGMFTSRMNEKGYSRKKKLVVTAIGAATVWAVTKSVAEVAEYLNTGGTPQFDGMNPSGDVSNGVGGEAGSGGQEAAPSGPPVGEGSSAGMADPTPEQMEEETQRILEAEQSRGRP